MEPLKEITCNKCSFKLKVGVNIHGFVWCPICGNVLVDGHLVEDDESEDWVPSKTI